MLIAAHDAAAGPSRGAARISGQPQCVNRLPAARRLPPVACLWLAFGCLQRSALRADCCSRCAFAAGLNRCAWRRPGLVFGELQGARAAAAAQATGVNACGWRLGTLQWPASFAHCYSRCACAAGLTRRAWQRPCLVFGELQGASAAGAARAAGADVCDRRLAIFGVPGLRAGCCSRCRCAAGLNRRAWRRPCLVFGELQGARAAGAVQATGAAVCITGFELLHCPTRLLIVLSLLPWFRTV